MSGSGSIRADCALAGYSSFKGLHHCPHQRVRPLAAVSPGKVVQVQVPHHVASESTIHHVFHLEE